MGGGFLVSLLMVFQRSGCGYATLALRCPALPGSMRLSFLSSKLGIWTRLLCRCRGVIAWEVGRGGSVQSIWMGKR